MVAWGNRVGVGWDRPALSAGMSPRCRAGSARTGGAARWRAGCGATGPRAAHDKSRRRARRCRRQPLLADPRRLELVARLIRDRHRPPGVRIEGRIMTRAPRPGGGRHNHPSGRSTAARGTTPSAGTTRMRPARGPRRRRRKGPRPRAGHPRAGRAARHRRPARAGGSAGRWRHRRGPYERRRRSPRRGRATRWCPVGAQGPLQTRGGRLTAQSRGPGPPHRLPLTVDRGHGHNRLVVGPVVGPPHRGPGPRACPPGPRPPRTTGRPLYFCQAHCPWQRGTGENTNTPAARGAPPPGPHWTASTPRGSNRCTINSTNDHANASTGTPPPRKPTHTTRRTPYEKPKAL